jgi:hypothetical protein
MLVKSQRVMKYAWKGDKWVFFESRYEDTKEAYASVGIIVTDWEDMLEPEEITVTIEPGFTIEDEGSGKA